MAILLGAVYATASYGQIPEWNKINIIPKPKVAAAGEGYFSLKPNTGIFASPAFLPVARLFIQQAGLAQSAQSLKGGNATMGNISFIKASRKTFYSPAAYMLEITSAKVTITAGTDTGALNGMYSLLQLLFLQAEKGTIPCALIVDQPRFSYRGIHLDVSRHFAIPPRSNVSWT